jgi:hypothetical protein
MDRALINEDSGRRSRISVLNRYRAHARSPNAALDITVRARFEAAHLLSLNRLQSDCGRRYQLNPAV